MLEQIWRDIKRLRINYLITPEGHEESTREHEHLVNAIESHDHKRIRQIIQKHSASSKKGILATLSSAEP
jgi:DNA-binding GntR family transcriptional regulator